MEILKEKRELKELIHMGHDTISTYIKQLKELDLLDKTGDSIILKAKDLMIDLSKDKFVEEINADIEHIITFNESESSQFSESP